MVVIEVKMALRNLLASRRRTALTLMMMMVGLGALLFLSGWINWIKIAFREQLILEDLGHFQIYPAGHLAKQDDSQSDILFSSTELEQLSDLLSDMDEVDFVNPRIYYSGSISGNNFSSRIFLGYSGDSFFETEMVAPIMTAGEFLNPQLNNPIVLGKGLAQALAVAVGDQVTLVVPHDGGRVDANIATVSGLADFEIPELNNRMVISTLDMAHGLVDGAAQRLVVKLQKTELLPAAIAKFKQQAATTGIKFELKTWLELASYYNKVLQLYNNQLTVLSIVLMFMFAIVIANTIFMSIMERQAEIGTLRAIGISGAEVMRIILYEGFFLGVAGIIVGTLFSFAVQFFLELVPLFQPPPPGMTDPVRISMTLTLPIILLFGSVQLLIALLSSLFPALRALRMNIISAIRQLN